MAGEFGDVEPIPGIDGLRPTGEEYDRRRDKHGEPPRRTAVRGEIVAVNRRNVHRDGQGHVLDVTVGGEEHTELVIRVPNRPYGRLEGRRVVIYLEEAE